jgi:hypothetical protein
MKIDLKKIIGVVSFFFIPLVCFASVNKDIYKVCSLNCDATFQPLLHSSNPEDIHQVAVNYYNCIAHCEMLCRRHGGSLHRVDNDLSCVKIFEVK